MVKKEDGEDDGWRTQTRGVNVVGNPVEHSTLELGFQVQLGYEYRVQVRRIVRKKD